MANAFRMNPSENSGYAPGKVVVQYYDREAKVWFDIGDPLTRQEGSARIALLRSGDYDLPEGHRWATAEECELIAASDWPDTILSCVVVNRSFSSNGHKYTESEADIAVEPKGAPEEPCDEMIYDGTDTDGTIWNRCKVHGELVMDGAYVCEAYKPPPYTGSH